MPVRRWPRRASVGRRKVLRSVRWTLAVLLAALLIAGISIGSAIFRSTLTELAADAANDAVAASINTIVKDIMADESFGADSLVNLERNAEGSITAITTNVAAINTLAAEAMLRAEAETAENSITVAIPLGNLLGSVWFTNKGPDIHVDVIMLSSSGTGFHSEFSSAGINQTRHQLFLDLTVNISLMLPWKTVYIVVDTEILVSETVIVGEVPESYMNWEN